MEKNLLHLVIERLKSRKKYSILMLLILFFSFSFLVISLTVNESLEKTNQEYLYDTYGTWDAVILEGERTDAEILSSIEDIDVLGTSILYGRLKDGSGIGTLDNLLIKMGRISLQTGRFPKHSGEIAMEADCLSALGYSYELGQEIILEIQIPAKNIQKPENEEESFQPQYVTIEETFTLCGVIKEYADLWRSNNHTLVSAVVMDQKGQLMHEAAGQLAKDMSISSPVYQYFFKTEDSDKQLEHCIRMIKESLEKEAVINSFAMKEQGTFSYAYVYVILIILTTMMAVICTYVFQLHRQVHQTALFRSIGITKRQLGKMLFYETLCIAVPAIILGVVFGIIGTWLFLKVLMNYSFDRFYVSIPLNLFIITIILWLACVFLTRYFVLQISLKQPFTGRMQLEGKKYRKYRKSQKRLINVLPVMFCGLLIFIVLECQENLFLKNKVEEMPSYRFDSFSRELPKITKGQLKTIEKIPGISEIKAWSVMNAELYFQGMEKNELVHGIKDDEEATNQDYEIGLGVPVYGIREEEYGKYFDLEELGISEKEFSNGEKIILLFLTDVDGNFIYKDGRYSETGMTAGTEIMLNFYGSLLNEYPPIEELLYEWKTEVGTIIPVIKELDTKLQFFSSQPYTVLCSDNFMNKILMELPEGYGTSYYIAGRPGYIQGEIYTSNDAGYLSTDYVIADFAAKLQVKIDNYREERGARLQEAVQTFIHLVSGGGCILLIILLVLNNVLSLRAMEEKRSYGILMALGMSERQMRTKIILQGLIHGIIAVIGGWMLYGISMVCYSIGQHIRIYKFFGEDKTLQFILNEKLASLKVSGVGWGWVFLLSFIGILSILIIYYNTQKLLLQGNIIESPEVVR